MADLRLLDLFSGIGGFSYAAEHLVGGYKTVGFCDNDPFCRQVLQKHWPDVEIFDDVRRTDDFIRCGRVDVITGGYPCQPFSRAGKQKGAEDDRHLWPSMFELIKQKRPAFVIGENVAGHITLGLDEVLFDLESEGYSARPFVIPAVAVDAHHRRDRVWIVAHADTQGEPDVTGHAEAGQRLGSEDVGHAANDGRDRRSSPAKRERSQGEQSESGSGLWREPSGSGTALADADGNRWRQKRPDDRGGPDKSGDRPPGRTGRGGEIMADADRARLEERQGFGSHNEQKLQAVIRRDWWLAEPDVGRVAHGLPGRVDRLKSLGNSIVPQVAAQILAAIKEAHRD